MTDKTLRVACVQMRAGVDIGTNIADASSLIGDAVAAGAKLVATPEMTALLDIRPGMARQKVTSEADDRALAAFRQLAADHRIWLLIGSLAVTSEADERFANRSCVLSPSGDVFARYDKIHMFDVEVGDGQTYRESRAYHPGEAAVVARTSLAAIGMTICYDLRFPHLYRDLARAGAELMMVPSAFTRVTGEAHWRTLLRARAIETGSFVIAPAQGGVHEDGRETYGHSMIISPWGDVLAEAGGDEPGIVVADLDLSAIARARSRIPSLGLQSDYVVQTVGV